ncbi:MAG: LysR substrate-binding domain-containing protein [Steroidobacteraceae bacterium]|jgi:flavin reductase (DIM6/NTAB) family NADH-FMN oxidoreductase RutF
MAASAAAAESAHEDGLLRRRFLNGMSHAACTVNVVTTDGPAGRHGVTVSAMVSVSADTPQPTLLVCIHHLSPVASAVLENGAFCVNVLREDQTHISESFAGRTTARGGSKFDCSRWTTQVTGAPRVVDALVAFDCRVIASERVGSHFVVFGSVQDIFIAGGGAPLIYANRAYGVPQRFHAPGAAAADPEASGGTLALGCFQIFAPYIVPAIVARMTKLDPAFSLSLLEADQRHLLASLRSGEVEVALLYDFYLGEGIRAERLAELVPYVLLPEGHPLADRSALTLEDLASEPLILLDLEPSRDYFLSLFRAHGLAPRIGQRTRSLEMVRGLVGHGLGYGLLATKPANNMSYDGRALVTRPLASAAATSRLVLATRSGVPSSPAAQAFAGHCRSFFGVSHAHTTT